MIREGPRSGYPPRSTVVNRLKPTVRHVSEIVPQNIIPKLKPTPPLSQLQGTASASASRHDRHFFSVAAGGGSDLISRSSLPVPRFFRVGSTSNVPW